MAAESVGSDLPQVRDFRLREILQCTRHFQNASNLYTDLARLRRRIVVILGGSQYENSLNEHSCQHSDSWHSHCTGYGNTKFARLSAAGYDAGAIPKSAVAADDVAGFRSRAAGNIAAERIPRVTSWAHSHRTGQRYSGRFDEDHRRKES
jgi:hypothetical protein